ncbi:2-hydroxyacid dehydrogenase [Falsibacillus pallidus]|uniref:Glyoxylate reductase n=1 Tax=Falsibacillus pallidus TaxID=493781 RepID=A0A370GGF3_9BACI|nr:D-glycerate dehydrogenase [Falsibacillus pallidus]RDI41464.1 glyoxylate reductase [Falsibacillus pallidus]
MKRIVITRKLPAEAIAALQDNYQVSMWDSEEASAPREWIIEQSKEADALLTMLSDKIDAELLQGASKLKVVANLAVGFDNIDIQEATERGVAVCNTPDVLTETTADLTFALLMGTARRIGEAAQFVKEGKWKSWSPLLLAGGDIYGKTIGIYGMGSIGEAVARRAKGFNMEILYHNRSRKKEAENQLGASYVEFEELLSSSDFIVCLAPLTPETKGAFNADAFSKMKSSAYFINAARGPIVDEDALLKALEEGEIAGAGLDVFTHEPISQDHPLLSLPNVLALPHIGSSSVETRMTMMELCVENIANVLDGKNPKTLVNKEWMK